MASEMAHSFIMFYKIVFKMYHNLILNLCIDETRSLLFGNQGGKLPYAILFNYAVFHITMNSHA